MSEGSCSGARSGSGRGAAGGASRGGAAAARGRRAAPGFWRLRRGHQQEATGGCTQSLETQDFGAAEGGEARSPAVGKSCAVLLSSFADSASLGPFRKWVGVVWPASGGIRTPASRKKEFTCVSRQRAGLEGSGGQLSLLAQWAVR